MKSKMQLTRVRESLREFSGRVHLKKVLEIRLIVALIAGGLSCLQFGCITPDDNKQYYYQDFSLKEQKGVGLMDQADIKKYNRKRTPYFKMKKVNDSLTEVFLLNNADIEKVNIFIVGANFTYHVLYKGIEDDFYFFYHRDTITGFSFGLQKVDNDGILEISKATISNQETMISTFKIRKTDTVNFVKKLKTIDSNAMNGKFDCFLRKEKKVTNFLLGFLLNSPH